MNVRCLARISGISHDRSYLGALAAIALSLSVLMAVAWMVQQRTVRSGRCWRSRGECAIADHQSRTQHVLSAAAAKGSGHMSFVSRIIGTAERVPLPDVIIRAAIQRLCSRTATRLASGSAESDAAFADEMAARAIAEYTDEANGPALRSAGGVLRADARPEPQIFLLLLQGAGLDVAGGRGRSAAPDHRACRSRRRPGDPRTRLRLGFAVAVRWRGDFRIRRHHRGVEFAFAARIYRAGEAACAD